MGTHQLYSSQPHEIRLILILPPSPREEAASGRASEVTPRAETLIPMICANPALLLMTVSSAARALLPGASLKQALLLNAISR